MSSVANIDEKKLLNGSLSVVRKQVEEQRIKMLDSNPLFERMRISKTDPSLEKLKNELVLILMKAELRSVLGLSSLTTGLSIKIQSKQTAREAISEFLKKLDSKINFDDSESSSINRAKSFGYFDGDIVSNKDDESNSILAEQSTKMTRPKTLIPSQMPKVPPPPPKKKQAPASPLSQSNQTSVVDFDPDHYVLVLKGTDVGSQVH